MKTVKKEQNLDKIIPACVFSDRERAARGNVDPPVDDFIIIIIVIIIFVIIIIITIIIS